KDNYNHFGKIIDAINVDTRRVYFNNPKLFHRGVILPVLARNFANRQIPVGDPVKIEKSLTDYTNFHLEEGSLVSRAYRDLLKARQQVETQYYRCN
ncbi:MAG: hypothetical protein AAF195_01795, partial [Pseudomonadota bacterium]